MADKDDNPFAHFAYTGPSRTRPYQPRHRLAHPPRSTPELPELDVDAIEHILSFIAVEGSWETMCVALRVSRLWGAAVYRSVMHKFGFEKEQAIAFVEAALLGRNVFITGGPGTGKSYVTECITKVLRNLNVKTSIAAPTGVAANNVRGITTTRFIGARRIFQPKKVQLGIVCQEEYLQNSVDSEIDMDDENETNETQTIAYMPVQHKQCFDKKLQTLIIDEVSMLSDFKFQQLEYVVGQVVGTTTPFEKTVQLILVGDFAQLPAIIPNGTPEATAVNLGQFQRFLFKSKRWPALNLHTIELTVCKRSEHLEYAQLAFKLRNNIVDVPAWKAITRSEDAGENLAIFGNFAPRGSTRHEKDCFPCASNFNRQRLRSLPDEWIKLVAYSHQEGDIPIPESLPHHIWIKRGCRIQLRNTMFNGAAEGIANGMCGIVQECDGGYAEHFTARFFTSNNTSFTYDVGRTTVKSRATALLFDNDETPYARRSSRSQFSIRIAHGITAHGAQGQTIHEPFIVQCDQCWDSGHLLVMLSRASDPSLMRLVNLDRARPFIAPAVLKFHRQIRTAMQQRHAQLWYVA